MSWFSTDLVDVNLVEDRTPGEDGSTAPVSEQNPLAGVDGTVVLVIGGEDDVIGLTGNTYFPIEMMKVGTILKMVSYSSGIGHA